MSVGTWKVLEVVEEDFYDGPICTVEIGQYNDEEPRLAIRLAQDKDEEYIEYRPELASVMLWSERLLIHREAWYNAQKDKEAKNSSESDQGKDSEE